MERDCAAEGRVGTELLNLERELMSLVGKVLDYDCTVYLLAPERARLRKFMAMKLCSYKI